MNCLIKEEQESVSSRMEVYIYGSKTMIKGRSSFTSSSRVKDVANRLNLEKKSNEDSLALVHWTLVLVTRIVSQVIVSILAGNF